MKDKLLVNWCKPVVLKQEKDRFSKLKGGPATFVGIHPDGYKVVGPSGSVYLFDSYGSFIDILVDINSVHDLCCVNEKSEDAIIIIPLPEVDGIEGQGIF